MQICFTTGCKSYICPFTRTGWKWMGFEYLPQLISPVCDYLCLLPLPPLRCNQVLWRPLWLLQEGNSRAAQDTRWVGFHENLTYLLGCINKIYISEIPFIIEDAYVSPRLWQPYVILFLFVLSLFERPFVIIGMSCQMWVTHNILSCICHLYVYLFFIYSVFWELFLTSNFSCIFELNSCLQPWISTNTFDSK